MASRCEVRLTVEDEPTAKRLAQMAIDEVRRIEAKYSRYRPGSVVSQISAQAGLGWVECDDETLALLEFADQLFEQSAGLFDITSGVLRRAWNFRQPALPSVDGLPRLLSTSSSHHRRVIWTFKPGRVPPYGLVPRCGIAQN